MLYISTNAEDSWDETGFSTHWQKLPNMCGKTLQVVFLVTRDIPVFSLRYNHFKHMLSLISAVVVTFCILTVYLYFQCLAADKKTYSMVVHTTVPFGLDNVNCNRDSVCYNVVLSRLRQLMPQLPASSLLSIEPYRWQYSQVCCRLQSLIAVAILTL